jgi:translation elongation factor EF-1beta
MDSNLYSRTQRYGKLWFKYDRMKRLIDELEAHGYIEKAPGFRDKYGRQTRIWATVKLIRIFVDEYKFQPIGDIHYTQPDNLIQLRDEYKKKNSRGKTVKVSEDVDFDPTDATELMEANLQQLNNLARAKKITVRLEGSDEINLEELTVNILSDLMKGKIELREAALIGCGSGIGSIEKNSTHPHSTIRSASYTQDTTDTSAAMDKLDIEVLTYKKYSYPVALYRSFIDANLNRTTLLSSITHTVKSLQYQGLQPELALFLHLLWMKKLLSLMNARAKKEEFMKQDRPLIDFGIKKLVFEIKVKDMHRVFNRGSKDFDKGGRFYPVIRLFFCN